MFARGPEFNPRIDPVLFAVGMVPKRRQLLFWRNDGEDDDLFESYTSLGIFSDVESSLVVFCINHCAAYNGKFGERWNFCIFGRHMTAP